MPFYEAKDVNKGKGRFAPCAAKWIGRFLLGQWLIIAMGIACMLAYFFPDVAKQDGVIKAQYSILYGAVILIFFISGLSIPRDKLIIHLLNYRLHIITQGASYLLIPLFVFGGVYLIDATDPDERLDRAVLAGYILLGCLPTTLSSNVIMTRTAGGDDAAALVEVLIANVLGPFITPGWTMALMPRTPRFQKWASSNGGMSSIYASTFKELSFSVLAPLLVGQVTRWTFPNAVPKFIAKFRVSKLSSVCLLLIVWSSFSTCFSTHALEALSDQTIAFTTLMNVTLYLFWTAMCFFLARPPTWLLPLESQDKGSCLWKVHHAIIRRMSVGETIAICFCGPAKTTGIGIPVLYAMYSKNDMFDNARMSVPVILYTTQQIFAAHFMVHLIHRWGEKAKKVECGDAIMDGDEELARSKTNSNETIVASPCDFREEDKEKKLDEEDLEPISRPETAATCVEGRPASPLLRTGFPERPIFTGISSTPNPLNTFHPRHSTSSFQTTKTLIPED